MPPPPPLWQPPHSNSAYTFHNTNKLPVKSLLLFSFQFLLQKIFENIVVEIKRFRGCINTLPYFLSGSILTRFRIHPFCKDRRTSRVCSFSEKYAIRMTKGKSLHGIISLPIKKTKSNADSHVISVPGVLLIATSMRYSYFSGINA